MYRETFESGEPLGKVEIIGENLIKRLSADVAREVDEQVKNEDVEAWYRTNKEAQATVLASTQEKQTEESDAALSRKLAEIYKKERGE